MQKITRLFGRTTQSLSTGRLRTDRPKTRSTPAHQSKAGPRFELIRVQKRMRINRQEARSRAQNALIWGAISSLLVLAGCQDQPDFNASAPQRGPGDLVGRDDPLSNSFQGGVDLSLNSREVDTPDWRSCDTDCQDYCSSQEFDNPLDRAICPALWGSGYQTRPVNEAEACRRLYADLRGTFPTFAEASNNCIGKNLSNVAQRLIKNEAFVYLNQRRWADILRYNNGALNLERIYDADVLVGKLYRGEIRFDEFVEVVSAHPVLTRRFDDPGDRVAGLFDIFVGRPPFDNERADMSKLYVLWENGYHDHPELGLRMPDSFIEHRCTNEEGEVNEDTAGACTSVLWGFNRVILLPDFRSVDNRTWAGNLTADEWRLLQTPGRIIGAWPEVWEKAARDVLSLYLGYDLGQYLPSVVQALVEHILEHGGDIRAAHHAVVTSQLYLQSATCEGEECESDEDTPRWTYGPLRQADPELWVDSLRSLSGLDDKHCDHRIPMTEDLLGTTLAAYELVDASYWDLTEEDEIETSYAQLVKTLGGCPDNEVSGRFKTVSILNTATQEGYAKSLCNPALIEESGVEAKVLLPNNVGAASELNEDVAVRILRYQIGKFFGRKPVDAEVSMARTGASACVPQPCSAETFGRSLCYALLSSSEMLFY